MSLFLRCHSLVSFGACFLPLKKKRLLCQLFSSTKTGTTQAFLKKYGTTCFTRFVNNAIGPPSMVVAEQVSCAVYLASKKEANEKTQGCVLLRCLSRQSGQLCCLSQSGKVQETSLWQTGAVVLYNCAGVTWGGQVPLFRLRCTPLLMPMLSSSC